jgi:hypothetical protein
LIKKLLRQPQNDYFIVSIKKGESHGGKSHVRTMITVKLNKIFKNEHTSRAAQADCSGNMSREGLRRGAGRRELRKRGERLSTGDQVSRSKVDTFLQHIEGFLFQQYTSAYVCIRLHTSAYACILDAVGTGSPKCVVKMCQLRNERHELLSIVALHCSGRSPCSSIMS